VSTGVPCFVEHIPGLEQEFVADEHVITFTAETFADRAEHYLRHYENAQRIGDRGREWVFAHHTYRHRLETMFGLMR